MFSKSVNLANFKKDAEEYLKPLSEPLSTQVIQLFQNGTSIKVILTQENYFQMLEKIEAYERKLGIIPEPTKKTHTSAIITEEEICNSCTTLTEYLGEKNEK